MVIKVLDSKTISQIAAGEVIERPASVVKELVENSLDAKATQVTIEIKSGGISFIRIIDNGTGIPDSETELAFERHATSKIRLLVDLQHLSSLGFRGEALPSIAAVAQVQLVTSVPGAPAGSYLSLDDGRIVQHEFQARSPGTTITVQNLFRKIPARLKFLKSINAEGGRIADIVSQYALAYPEIKFTLIADDKTTLRTPGSGKLPDAVMSIYGLEVARNMIPVNSRAEGSTPSPNPLEVTGLVGSPKISRANRNYLSFFVNRRWVNNRLLNFAVEEAYHGLLMQGKHPVAVINISLPPALIDVNVHPSKTEIKFQDERAIFATVQKAVRQALVQSIPVPQVEESRPYFGVPSTPFSKTQSQIIIGNAVQGVSPQSTQSSVPIAPTPLISLPLLRVLGQLARNYIVAEGPDGLYIIDQHAAHERIQLEKIKKERTSQKIEIQGLLEPVPFEVEPKQALTLQANLREISDFGFDIEFFGEHTYLVRSIPAVLRDKDWAGALREALDTLSNNWTENLAVILACHSAIRAGQILGDTEIRELIHQLEQTALPNSCPHGRPTMIQIPLQRLEKEFGRS